MYFHFWRRAKWWSAEHLPEEPPARMSAWQSPLLKKNLALASVVADQGKTGNELRFEVTVEYERRMVKATVVDKPFYDPEWKRK